MLTKLFNSQAKVKLIQYFLSTPNVASTPVEAGKKTRMSPETARSTCLQLKKLGLLKTETTTEAVGKAGKQKKKKGYMLDTTFPLHQEIKALFMKSQLLFEGDLVDKMKKTGGAMMIILTGVFTGTEDDGTTDLLIIGKINRDKLSKMITSFEKKLGFEINYTVLSRSEYYYRRDITDRFLYGILEQKHIVLLDKLHGKR